MLKRSFLCVYPESFSLSYRLDKVKEIIVTDTINLSKRLATVATFLPSGAFFADIGSDHAYLPCYVCKHDKQARAIAGEVNEGPYNSACETVKAYELNNQIEVRLCDGLHVIDNEQIKQVVIAGMGGSLIAKILEEGRQYLSNVERIIAQPNIGEINVRKWFLENRFLLKEETIVEENGHLYEILVADKGENDLAYTDQELNKQLFFGPLLLQEKSSAFIKKWTLQKRKQQQSIAQIKLATVQDNEKIKQLEREFQWIEEVLLNEKRDC